MIYPLSGKKDSPGFTYKKTNRYSQRAERPERPILSPVFRGRMPDYRRHAPHD